MKKRVAGLVAMSIALTPVSLRPAAAAAGSVHAQFDLDPHKGVRSPATGLPSPTRHRTRVFGSTNADCAARPSDCSDIDVLNELDGFNLEPRLAIPFDGRIDVGSVTSQDVFLVSLGSTLPGGDSGGEVVGIDQVVSDTFTNTLYVESDDALNQHTRYVLVVTQSVLDESGKHVKAAKEFLDLVNNENGASIGDPMLDAYRTSLRDALLQIDQAGIVPLGQVVAASVFTTQSATAVMEKIRDQIKAATPDAADFQLGPDGSRTVFDRSTVTEIRWKRQSKRSTRPIRRPFPKCLFPSLDHSTSCLGVSAPSRLAGTPLPTIGSTPGVHPGSRNAFRHSARSRDERDHLRASICRRPEPDGGYPVAISGHGGAENKTASQLVAANLAVRGSRRSRSTGPDTVSGRSARMPSCSPTRVP